MVKLLTGLSLPETLPEFLYLVKTTLGYVYDVKHIASFYGFDEKVGLVKMADTLDVSWEGQKHQAGYDSMITGLVFWKIKEIFGVDEDECEGIMFGAEQCGLVQKTKTKMFDVDEDEYEGIIFGAEQCGLVQTTMYQCDGAQMVACDDFAPSSYLNSCYSNLVVNYCSIT